MKRVLLLPALLLCASFLWGCAEETAEFSYHTEQALQVLPPEAPIMGMVHMDQREDMMAFVERLSNEFPAIPNPSDLEDDEDLQEIMDAIGFDPRTDIKSLYFALDNPEGNDGLEVIVKTDYDRETLDTFVQEKLQEEDPEGRVKRAMQDDVITYCTEIAEEDHTLNWCVALPDNNTMVFAPSSALSGVLNRLSDNRGTLERPAAVTALMNQIRGNDQAWIVVNNFDAFADLPDPNEFEGEERNAIMIGRAVNSMVMSAGFHEDEFAFETHLHTHENVAASDVADLLKGLISTARIEMQNEEQLLDMLDQIRVRVRDRNNLVEINLEISEATIKSVLEKISTEMDAANASYRNASH